MRIYPLKAIPGLIYLVLASGAVLPLLMGNTIIFIHSIIFLLYILYILNLSKVLTQISYRVLLFVPLSVTYMFLCFGGRDLTLIYERLNGGLASTFIIIIMGYVYFKNFSDVHFKNAFIKFATFILITTIFYKLANGFFDRSERFFLNGPIVFGWLMGYCAILIFDSILRERLNIRLLAFFFVFFLSVIWTGSKGPLLAMFVAIVFLVMCRMGRSRTYKNIIPMLLSMTCILFALPESFTSRFSALFRIFSAQSDQRDYGSIGIREKMWSESWEIFFSNPIWGVGVGNWQFFTPLGDYRYPHNMVAELAAETGVVGVSLFLSLICILFIFSSTLMRSTILFFVICTSFSGDFQYARFIFGLPIANILAQNVTFRNKNPSSLAA